MKKSLALFFALLMCLSLLSLPAVAESEPEVFRYDEPITLKVAVFDRGLTGGTPVDNNYWTDWIQKNFGDPRNITIEWVVVPRGEEIDKVNILMASGEAADIHFTYTEAVITNFVNQGGLVELSDLINEHGANIKKLLGEQLLSYGIFEGGQYAIPARRIVLATQGMFLREDWIEKLGMKMPTTKGEFVEVLRAFRDKNPGNVEGGAIPYAQNNDLTTHNHLMLSFIKDLSEKTLATVPDVMWDGYEDYVVFLNMLYNEGLLSPDFALDASDLHLGAVTSGKAGGYSYNYDHPIRVSPGILHSLQAYEPEAKLSPVNAFESVTDPTKYYHGMYAPNGIFAFVPVYAKHPEAAIMYLDWLSQYDVNYFLQNGEEGVHHTLNEDGIPVLIDVQDERKFNSMQNIDYTILINGTLLDTDEKTMAAQALSYQNYAELYEPMYTIYNSDPLTVNFHFDVVLESDAQYGTALTAFRRELLTKSVMAKPEDCLNVFRALRDEYMEMGGTAVMEEKIAAWDNMHK